MYERDNPKYLCTFGNYKKTNENFIYTVHFVR